MAGSTVASTSGFEHRVSGSGVELALLGMFPQQACCLVPSVSWTKHLFLGHPLIPIGGGKDPSLGSKCNSRVAVWVARTIEALIWHFSDAGLVRRSRHAADTYQQVQALGAT